MYYSILTDLVEKYKSPKIPPEPTFQKTNKGNIDQSNDFLIQQEYNVKNTRNFLTPEMLEKKFLATKGLIEGKNVFIHNVKISKGHVHTLEAGRNNTQKLVLIHGYGASGVFYANMIHYLKEYFHVFAIDQYGTGLSSRPIFEPHQLEEAENFFCGAIEEWRLKLKIDNFILVGHSFGGFTAGRYFISRRPNIIKLFLLSPAGFTTKEKSEIFEAMKQGREDTGSKFGKVNFIVRGLYDMVFNAFQKHTFCPHQLGNILGRQDLLKNFFGGGRLGFTPKESKIMSEYYYLITEMNYSGDKALGSFLYYARYSKHPLIRDFKSIQEVGNLPETYIYYGDADWMDRDHSLQQIQKYGLKINYEVIEGAGHQMTLQAPITLCRKIVESCGFEFVDIECEDLLDENFMIVDK